ncbi:MAG: biotin--[acetyl-CoA-carboxylase] ligase [Candidatus Eisenbacteria bacterium]
MNQQILEEACRGSALVVHCRWVDEIDSTQEELRRLAPAGPGMLVAAGTQTSGRGRRGRCWFSSAGGGLWFSLLFTPPRAAGEWPFMTALAALALREALRRETGLTCGLKWPNDLLLGGCKIAGILAETVAGSVALGVGVNLAQGREDFPEELRDLAVSARMASGRAPAPGVILRLFLEGFERRSERFGRDGAAVFREELLKASVLLGRMVRLSDGRHGRVVDLGPGGELILEAPPPAGHLLIASGEIESIEPPLRPR